jgi:hypothetical protein
MSRWPRPVREPLPVGLLSEADIEEAVELTTRFLRDPEDPKFDPMVFGLLCAARSALFESLDALVMARIGREMAEEDDEPEPDYRKWERIGQEYVARKVARRVIDELRQWLPER